MNDIIYIPCECHTEGVVVNHDSDTDTFDMSFVSKDKHAFQMIWIERLKLCWRVLTTGRVYHDQVIMNKKNAGMLVNHLIKHGAETSHVETYTIDETNRTETI